MEIPTITSSQNRLISRVRQLLNRPRECRKEGVLIADGIHLVQEALRADLPCQALFVQEKPSREEIRALVRDAEARRLTAYPVAPHIFRAISPVETPQGIVGVFERPKMDRATLWAHLRGGDTPGDIVVADGIQDPINIGSITRSCWAAGVRGLVTTPQTVDPFHHRALRAAQGASFHLPILADEPPLSLVTTLRNIGCCTLALSPRGEIPLAQLDPSIPYAFFFGSEGSGLSKQLEEAVDLRVAIPMENGVESLGVAASAAVVFFHLRMQRAPRNN